MKPWENDPVDNASQNAQGAKPWEQDPLSDGYVNRWPSTSYLRSPEPDFTSRFKHGDEVILSTDGKSQVYGKWNAQTGMFDTNVDDKSKPTEQQLDDRASVASGKPVYRDLAFSKASIHPSQVLGYANEKDKIESAKVAFTRSVVPTAAGFGGFAAGAGLTELGLGLAGAPETFGLSLLPLIPGAIGAYYASDAANNWQNSHFPITPEQQLALDSNPATSKVAAFAPALIASPTSPKTWGNALGFGGAGTVAPAVKQLAGNAGLMGAMGTATDVGDNLRHGRPALQNVDIGSILGHAGTGLILGEPNKIGQTFEAPGKIAVNVVRAGVGQKAKPIYKPSEPAKQAGPAVDPLADLNAATQATREQMAGDPVDPATTAEQPAKAAASTPAAEQPAPKPETAKPDPLEREVQRRQLEDEYVGSSQSLEEARRAVANAEAGSPEAEEANKALSEAQAKEREARQRLRDFDKPPAAEQPAPAPAASAIPEGHVPPSPEFPGADAPLEVRLEWAKAHKAWDAQYGKTHWTSGRPKDTTATTQQTAAEQPDPAVTTPKEATPAPAAEKAPVRPEAKGNDYTEQDAWDAQYGKTHWPSGNPKQPSPEGWTEFQENKWYSNDKTALISKPGKTFQIIPRSGPDKQKIVQQFLTFDEANAWWERKKAQVLASSNSEPLRPKPPQFPEPAASDQPAPEPAQASLEDQLAYAREKRDLVASTQPEEGTTQHLQLGKLNERVKLLEQQIAERDKNAQKPTPQPEAEDFDPSEDKPNPKEDPKDVAERERLWKEQFGESDAKERSDAEAELELSRNVVRSIENQIAKAEKAGKGDTKQTQKLRDTLAKERKKLAGLEGSKPAPAAAEEVETAPDGNQFESPHDKAKREAAKHPIDHPANGWRPETTDEQKEWLNSNYTAGDKANIVGVADYLGEASNGLKDGSMTRDEALNMGKQAKGLAETLQGWARRQAKEHLDRFERETGIKIGQSIPADEVHPITKKPIKGVPFPEADTPATAPASTQAAKPEATTSKESELFKQREAVIKGMKDELSQMQSAGLGDSDQAKTLSKKIALYERQHQYASGILSIEDQLAKLEAAGKGGSKQAGKLRDNLEIKKAAWSESEIDPEDLRKYGSGSVKPEPAKTTDDGFTIEHKKAKNLESKPHKGTQSFLGNNEAIEIKDSSGNVIGESILLGDDKARSYWGVDFRGTNGRGAYGNADIPGMTKERLRAIQTDAMRQVIEREVKRSKNNPKSEGVLNIRSDVDLISALGLPDDASAADIARAFKKQFGYDMIDSWFPLAVGREGTSGNTRPSGFVVDLGVKDVSSKHGSFTENRIHPSDENQYVKQNTEFKDLYSGKEPKPPQLRDEEPAAAETKPAPKQTEPAVTPEVEGEYGSGSANTNASRLREAVGNLEGVSGLTLENYTPSEVEIANIEATQKGAGYGTKAMEAIVKAADKLGINLMLIPAGDAAKRQRLEDFYSRFGFESDGEVMRRTARRAEQEQTVPAEATKPSPAVTKEGDIANHGNPELARRGFITAEASKMPSDIREFAKLVIEPVSGENNKGFFKGKMLLNGKTIAEFDYNHDANGDDHTSLDWIKVNKDYQGKGLSKVIQAEIIERAKRLENPSQTYGATVTDPKNRPTRGMESLLGKENVRQDGVNHEPTHGRDPFRIKDPETGEWLVEQKDVSADIPNQYTPEQRKLISDIKEAHKAGVDDKTLAGLVDRWSNDVLKPGKLLSVGPEDLAALAWKTGRAIQKGITNFAKWSAEQIATYGEKLRPYLKQLWDKAHEIQDNPRSIMSFFSSPGEAGSQAARDVDLAQIEAASGGSTAKLALNLAKSRSIFNYRDISDSSLVKFMKSVGTRIRTVADINQQSATARRIADDFSLAPGQENSKNDRDYGTALSNQNSEFLNRLNMAFGPVLDRVRQMAPEERAKFNDLFIRAIEGRLPNQVGGETGKAVERVKALLAEMHQYGLDAGIKMGKVEDYFPRSIDADAVAADPEGFVEAAAKAYEERWNREQAEAEEPSDKAPDFVEQAEAWKENILLGRDGMDFERSIFDNRGVAHGEDFQESRKFTKEEAAIFDAYRDKDIARSLTGYVGSLVRRAEIARRLGADGKGWGVAKRAMLKEKVSPEHIKEMETALQSYLGVSSARLNESDVSLLNANNAFVTAAFLKTTGLLNLVETGSMGIRTSNPVDSAKAMLTNLNRVRNILLTRKDAFNPDALKQGIEAAYGKGHDLWSALALEMGINKVSKGFESISSGFHADEGSSGDKWRERADAIHRLYGIHATEVAKRETSLRIGSDFIDRVISHTDGSNGLVNALKKAGLDVRTDNISRDRLAELGVKPEDQKAFGEWVKDMRKLSPEEQLGRILDRGDPMAAKYRNALQLFSKQSMVQANRASKTIAANDTPLGKVLFQLTTYPYEWSMQHTRNMAEIARKVTSKNGYSGYERLMATGAYGAFAMLTAAYTGFGELRKAINGAEDKKEDPNAMLPNWAKDASDAFMFTGVTGPAEMVWKAIERGQMPGGVVGDWAGKTIKTAMELYGNPNSNSAQRNATRAAYRTGFVPAANIGLGAAATVAPPWAKPIIAGTAQFIANPQTEKEVADEVAGPSMKKKR